MKGRVLWYNWDKKYGFCFPESNIMKTYFIHASNIISTDNPKKPLTSNDNIEFDVGHGPDGREVAINVRKVN